MAARPPSTSIPSEPEKLYTQDDLVEQGKLGRFQVGLMYLLQCNLPPIVKDIVEEIYVDYRFATRDELEQQKQELARQYAAAAAAQGGQQT